MGDNSIGEISSRRRISNAREHLNADNPRIVVPEVAPQQLLINLNYNFWKILCCIFLVVSLFIMEEFALSNDSDTLPDESHGRGVLLSHKRFVRSGEASFFLLFEPSDVEIILRPFQHDLDLYVVANEDFDYFKQKSPKLRELLEISKPTRDGISIVIMQQSFQWDVISPPQSPKTAEETDTLYWSELPPFSFSSATLGVEKVHVPSEREFVRPLLICVFAAPTGVGSYGSNYTIEIRNEKLHVSSYTTVRLDVERGTLSHSEMVRKFSTINSDTDDRLESRENSNGRASSSSSSRREQNSFIGSDDEDSDDSTNPLVLIARVLRPIFFGVLESLFNIIL